MHLNKYFWLLCVSLYCAFGSAQHPAAYRLQYKILQPHACELNVSEYSLMPATITIVASTDTLIGWKVMNNKIVLGDSLCSKYGSDSLLVSFRTFGFNIEEPTYVIDSSLLTFKEKALITVYEYRQNESKNGLIESRGLDYRGSFSRGLSIGNSQSLVLNSNFDMQLVGDLGNGLKVIAAISDENLPIQAQGNTQQLQEFDKVFIQVSKDRTSIIAGDYELHRPDSYFMNYFKKLKGISVSSTVNSGKGTEVFAKGSFAISRGKFARQTLKTSEGNQGPYRLQGNSNERFIIVLAGTERVYFNGILLTRGFDYDYVIDYNRAEITFSPTRVIARDSRVIVEFEYTDISYLRSMYATQTEFRSKKWKAGINFYSEQDSKNATGDVQLDSLDLQILQQSGDDLSRSVRNSIYLLKDEERRGVNRILYAGMPDPLDPSNIILRFTTNLDSAMYAATFTEVGQGKGDYIIDEKANKNGRVYRYVGNNMGSYLPVIQLIPPEKRQMVTVNGKYQFNRDASVFGEVAMSNYDVNRLSSFDESDNTGFSTHVAFNNRIKLDTAGQWSLNTSVKHEFVNKNFNELNPFRAPEFVRDWNISQLMSKGDEYLLLSSVSLNKRNEMKLEYGFNTYVKGDDYTGRKHQALWTFAKDRWNVRAFSDYLTSTASRLDQNTRFLRPEFSISYKISKKGDWSIGAAYDGESNVIRNIGGDSLFAASNQFHHLKWFVSNDFSKDFAMRLSYSLRDDYLGKQNDFAHASVAKELEWAGKWITSENSDLQWNIIGRQLDIKDPILLPKETSKNTILGKLDYVFSLFNQGIRSVTSYNTNSGQEPKVEYVYQKVEPGTGDYVFIGKEENANLNNSQDFRFDPSNPNRSYIRLTLTNNEFIRTNNIELNQSLHIEPVKFIKATPERKLSSFYRFISRFSTMSNAKITKKQMDNSSTSLTSFFNFDLQDTSLVSYNSTFSNTLFFNKGNVKYDIQIGNRDNQNRSLQVGDTEDHGINDWFFRTRLNILNRADLFLILEKSERTYFSRVFADRNLDLRILRLKPELSYRPSGNVRLTARYTYEDKRQQILTKDLAFINDFTGEFALRKANQYSFDLSLSYVAIQFSGESGSPLEYDMLDGLKNGKNFLWNLVFTRRVGKNIDLTVNYEGRKPGSSPFVHVGRAQIKATF